MKTTKQVLIWGLLLISNQLLAALGTPPPLNISPLPLFLAGTEPQIMLLLSRDEQLYIPAYTDYTDLNGNGDIDITYNDTINYYGYFDSYKCYTYSATNGYFSPSTVITHTAAIPPAVDIPGPHTCDGSKWSGNFLNWATMTRMDVVRKVLYGGSRIIDTATSGGTSGKTVLQRAFLPNDTHAFAKVYSPQAITPANPSIQSLTGITSTHAPSGSISICNVTDVTGTITSNPTGKMTTLPVPLIKVANDSWPIWAVSERTQCALTATTQPSSLINTYNAKVAVCVSGMLESNCKTYVTRATPPVETVKPTGLLQTYGDVDAVRRTKIGLMTGSYAKNKSGGVLRKNISYFANNTNQIPNTSAVCGNSTESVNATTIPPQLYKADEIDTCTGQFINQTLTTFTDTDLANGISPGIVYTLDNLRIAGFRYTSVGANGIYASPCDKYGLSSPDASKIESTTTSSGGCSDWGNPLGEIYLETLRYFSGLPKTTAFTPPDYNDSAFLRPMPASNLGWLDPLPPDQWCSLCNIVVLSTGINSFDMDQLADLIPTGGTAIKAKDLTTTVGTTEGISGNYMIGSNGTPTDNLCSKKTLTNLADARGICPVQPGRQGGYSIAGLALAPRQIDLRPNYAAKRKARWGGTNATNPDLAARQPINTYTVQLAQALPSFTVPVGSSTVTILPAFLSHNESTVGNATPWNGLKDGWRNGALVGVKVEPNVGVNDVGTDPSAKTRTCSGNGTTSQCFKFNWEDSEWGFDYDTDGGQRLGYCVGGTGGGSCSTFKMLCPSTKACDGGTNIRGVCTAHADCPGSTCGTAKAAYATIGPWATPTSSQILVATCSTERSTPDIMAYGYNISGTTADEVYLPVQGRGSTFIVGNVLPASSTAPSNTPVALTDTSTTVSPPATALFTVGPSSAKLLENPLWYAAKYGGFSNPNGTSTLPTSVDQWDVKNNTTGVECPKVKPPVPCDGVPDNYYDVINPATLVYALGKIFDHASKGSADLAAISTNSTRIEGKTAIYQAKFDSQTWVGQLLAYKINMDGTVDLINPLWDTNRPGAFPSHEDRKIFTWNGGGVEFAWDSLNTTQQTYLQNGVVDPIGATTTHGEKILNWLRGDDDNKQDKVDGTLRKREGKILGDIINSNPTYVGAANFGYTKLPPGTPGRDSYEDFVTRKRNPNRKEMLYVGANDGMLHGFDATMQQQADGTFAPTATTGVEQFAYIPQKIFPKLAQLADIEYSQSHQYFVDGSPQTGDVYFETKGWRTILVGNEGAGGRSVFALDVTLIPPEDNFSKTNVLWEFTDGDLGYPIGQFIQPSIGRMQNGVWAVIFGNGYNSDNHKACLYIVKAEDGALITKICTGEGDVGTPNGLAGPVLIADETRTIKYAYAGDLHGNLWKFDLSDDDDPNEWKIYFKKGDTPAPLFKARYVNGTTESTQPITAPPDVGVHPHGGYIVVFGTGEYFSTNSNTNMAPQSFYGIWDKSDIDGSPCARVIETDACSCTTVTDACVFETDRSKLQAQTIIDELTCSCNNDVLSCTDVLGNSPTGSCDSSNGSSTFNWRIISKNPINWDNGETRGWYIDLLQPSTTTPVAQGERVVSVPILSNGRAIFTTVIPTQSTNTCDAGGTGWLMEVNMYWGGRTDSSVFDVNTDSDINSSDFISIPGINNDEPIPFNGIQSDVGIITTPSILSAGEVEYKFSGGSSGSIMSVKEAGDPTAGRQTWQQIR